MLLEGRREREIAAQCLREERERRAHRRNPLCALLNTTTTTSLMTHTHTHTHMGKGPWDFVAVFFSLHLILCHGANVEILVHILLIISRLLGLLE